MITRRRSETMDGLRDCAARHRRRRLRRIPDCEEYPRRNPDKTCQKSSSDFVDFASYVATHALPTLPMPSQTSAPDETCTPVHPLPTGLLLTIASIAPSNRAAPAHSIECDARVASVAISPNRRRARHPTDHDRRQDAARCAQSVHSNRPAEEHHRKRRRARAPQRTRRSFSQLKFVT